MHYRNPETNPKALMETLCGNVGNLTKPDIQAESGFLGKHSVFVVEAGGLFVSFLNRGPSNESRVIAFISNALTLTLVAFSGLCRGMCKVLQGLNRVLQDVPKEAIQDV